MHTLIIINPNAGGGKATHIWSQIESHARARLGTLQVVVTPSQDDIAAVMDDAAQRGVTRIIAIGGDGTNHHVVNALVRHNLAHPDHPLTYATIPAGTGRDWSRGAGTPLDPLQAVDWVANTRLRAVDVGEAVVDGITQYFLNTSSVGVSSDVLQRVEASAKGGRATFLRAIVGAVVFYRPIPITIHVDGALWWDAPCYVMGVANGRYFGQGLMIAPNAAIDDGLLDVVGAGALRMPAVVRLVAQLYRGTHILNPQVQSIRGHTVKITSTSGMTIGFDLDGEAVLAQEIVYRVLPGALLMNT